jgi:hypothetical protein
MTDAPIFKRPRGRPPKNPRIETDMETDNIRPSVRDLSPREAAAQRAAELREHGSAVEDVTDKFYVDPRTIPDGWSYEWKRQSVYGQEDPSYQIRLASDGWTAVPASRHPEMMPLNSNEATIMRDGCVLMECPTEIVDERKANELRKARMQVRTKEAQLAGSPDGHFERDRPKISKAYSPIAIPE